MNIHHYMQPDGLFDNAFRDLKQILQEDAQTQKDACRWVRLSGKGGSQWPEYFDVSLYRHCMDVSTVAFCLFVHTWQAGELPHPTERRTMDPNDEETATVALKQLFAIAFLHDADKYWEAPSKSPTLDQVTRLHHDLKVQEWTGLSAKVCYAAVTGVERRGQDPFASRNSQLLDRLKKMVSVGDNLLSAISTRTDSEEKRVPQATLKSLLTALVEEYNRRLPVYHETFYIPKQPLRLFEFRHSPVVLHTLAQLSLGILYKRQQFPFVHLLHGERLYLTFEEETASEVLTEIFDRLQQRLSDNAPHIKRKNNSGEVSLAHIHEAATLINTLKNRPEPGLMTVNRGDWEIVNPYIRHWTSKMGLMAGDKPKQEKSLCLAIKRSKQDEQNRIDWPPRYLVALCIACALRAKREGQTETLDVLFGTRLEKLKEWNPHLSEVLSQGLNQVPPATLGKDTLQTIYALQAAIELPLGDDRALEKLVAHLYGEFPKQLEEDAGANAIIYGLKKQCGLVTEETPGPTEPAVYSATPKGGTCLLCGTPTTQKLTDEVQKVGTLKSSAFNNRIGQRKSIYSQSEKNFICPACVKQQSLLCSFWKTLHGRADSQPLLVATPFRSLIKPIKGEADREAGGGLLLSPCRDVDSNDFTQVLPWQLDTSGSFPLLLQPMDKDKKKDKDFKSTVETMLCLAQVALYSGNPVHVFISAQRDSRAAFVFEQTPPLIRKLLGKEIQPGEVRRNHLPALIKRLSLFADILRSDKKLKINNGHDVLNALPTDAYGWWAVAWLYGRYLDRKHQDSDAFAKQVNFAKEEYPMDHETDHQPGSLAYIANLATEIQTPPKWDASNSEKSFALLTVLEQFETSRRFQKHKCPAEELREEAVAAMAGALGTALERRHHRRFIKDENHLYTSRCKQFAGAVYDYVEQRTKPYGLDANFQRYLVAAYTFLFVEKADAKGREKPAEAIAQTTLFTTQNEDSST